MPGAASTSVGPGAGLRGGARLAFALLVVIMLASAFLRLAHGEAAAGNAVDIVRGIHRVAASLAFIVLVGVAIFGWDELQPLGGSRAALAAQVALAAALAFLGYYTPSDHPLVVFGNPLGGLAMVGLAWWLVLVASRSPPPRRPSWPVAAALAALAVAAVVAIVVWPPPLAVGLAVQVAAAAALAAGATILPGRGR
jgi:hypothetical protein